LTDVQLAAVASSFATSLSVSPAQVQLALAPSTHRRSLLLQGVQLGVTVTGLGSDAAAVKQAGTLLTSSAALSAMVARLASTEVIAVSATPVSVTSQLEVKVSVPATMSPAMVTATFSSSNAANLGAQLQAAGISISGIVFMHSDATAVQPPGPPPAATPETVKANNNVTIAISLSVFFVLLVCGASCYWTRRRTRRARKSVTHKWTGKTFGKDEEEYDDAYERPPPTTSHMRISALMVPSADAAPRRNMVIDQYPGGRSVNFTAAGYVMSSIAEAEAEAPAPEHQLPAALLPEGGMPTLAVPSAILDITAEGAEGLSPRSGPCSPALPAWAPAHGKRSALLIPSDAVATRRDVIFGVMANASSPQHNVVPHSVAYLAAQDAAPATTSLSAAAAAAHLHHNMLLQTFSGAGGSRDFALNLSGVEEEEGDEGANDTLLMPSYRGAP
jgi:hypothetical protein